MARHRDPLTKDLFSWQPPKVGVGYSEDVIGRGRLDNKIARLIAQALRDAREDEVSRAEVARRMSTFLGRTISDLPAHGAPCCQDESQDTHLHRRSPDPWPWPQWSGTVLVE